MYERLQVSLIRERMAETDNPLIQVVVGPRQTGKSTMIAQALDGLPLLSHSASADDLVSPTQEWLRQEWQQARNLSRASGQPVVLVLDEIQKIAAWPTIVKGLWDADQRERTPIKAFLSGSSSLLIRRGLEDSLKGRFELIRSPHWSLQECTAAFGFSLEDFLYFGGFPGAARFSGDETRWRNYMRDSIIEPTIAKDVLEDEDVRKPALMRALFELGVRFSAQELSYNKILGQLDDAGNATTLAHYLELLDKAGMLCGLEKFHPKEIQRRKSSPRFMVYDTSLMTAATGRNRQMLLGDSEMRGHLVESAVGAHLLALAPQYGFQVSWWREGNHEVDFVLHDSEHVVAVEVKSGRMKPLGGMKAFLKQYPHALRLIVGGTGSGSCTLEEFLADQEFLPWMGQE